MRATLSLPAASRSVGQARAFVRVVLGPNHERIDDAELLTSELVTNAVKHAHSEVVLTVELGDGIRIEVDDRMAPTGVVARRLEDPPEVPADEPGGRGLLLVNAIASRHGVEPGPGGGKTVWFEL